MTDYAEFMNLQPGELAVLGARPAMGKTAFAISLVQPLLEQGKRVVYISQSESEEQLRLRFLQCYAEVPQVKSYDMDGKLENGTRYWEGCDGIEIQRLLETRQILDAGNLNIVRDEEIKGVLNEDFVIVDYIQLFTETDSASEKNLQIETVLKQLKKEAIKNNCVVLVLSQLSRATEERIGHRPILTDYRDSASLQEVPDKCFFLFRREYYDPMDKPGQAELILAKNRFGSTGTIPLMFRKEIGQFANLSFDKYPGDE